MDGDRSQPSLLREAGNKAPDQLPANQCSGMDVSSAHCPSGAFVSCADHTSMPLIFFFFLSLHSFYFQRYSGSQLN